MTLKKRRGLLVPSLLGKDYVKQPGWQTSRNPLLPTFGNSISKQVPPKTAHALAVRRLSWIVWNNKSSMQPKKVDNNPSRRSQTTSSPKLVTQPSGMYWPRKDIIDMLHARYLTLQKSSRLNRFIGHACTRTTCRQNWEDVIWSDKCYVYLGNDWGRVYVTYCADKEYDEDCLVPMFKQSAVHVMVWGCIMKGQKGTLIVVEYLGGKGGGMNSAC